MRIHSEYFEKGSLTRRIQNSQTKKGFSKVYLVLFVFLFFLLSFWTDVLHASDCQNINGDYSISHSNLDFGPEGGVGWVKVTTRPDCTYTFHVCQGSEWISLSEYEFTGTQTVDFHVAINPDEEDREGCFAFNDEVTGGVGFDIQQLRRPAWCTYSLNPTNASFDRVGGTGTLEIDTQSGCTWGLTSVPSWITFTSDTLGIGQATLRYSVSANTTGDSRIDTMFIVGLDFTVTQSGLTPPIIGFQPNSFNFTATQGGANPQGSTLLIDNPGSGTLNWRVSDDASWLTLSPTRGTSTGEIDRVTVSVNIRGLMAGTYNANITITAQGATNSPVTIPVTLTVNPAPPSTIGFQPNSFNFTATQGGANPKSIIFMINNSGSGILNWSVSDDASWLTLNPTSGSSTGEVDKVTASVNISGLNAGTYNATITITGQGATNSPISIPVTLIVAPTAQSTIGYQPSSYTFTVTQGGANPESEPLMIDNSGSGTLSWKVIDNARWLTLSPTSGTSTGEIDRVTVSVNIRGLRAGSYNANIIIAAKGATNSPVTIPVTLTVNPPPPSTIGFQPSSYSFTATQGGANPQSSTLMIDNSGAGTLSWRVSDDAPWLTLSPASGTSTGEVDRVTVRVNIRGLNAGQYSATITITGQGATNSPVTIPVNLTVNSDQQSTIGFQPESFSFTANQGGANPSSKTLTVLNLGSGSMAWSASDNAQWLSLNPAQGTSAGEADNVTVSVNISGLDVGQYSATITITSQGATNSPVSIPVTLAVNVPQTQTAKSDSNLNLNYDPSLLQQTSDGGYIEAGETDSSALDGTDVSISKFDSRGNLGWQKTYGGFGDDWIYSIREASDGGYIVVGETDAFGVGRLCIWILKLDSSGNIQWQKAYDGYGNYRAYTIQQKE